jgi:hypothetical protein
MIVAGCSSSHTATTQKASAGVDQAKPAATAKGASVDGSCSSQSSSVLCTLPTNGNYLDLATLLTQAAAVDSSVTASTTMEIAAVGGAGGPTGSTPTADGGVAQTITTVAGYKSTYETSDLYYYLGANGTGNNDHGASGGASTIGSSQDLSAHAPCISAYGSCTTANIVLIAGGGGGDGAEGTECNGGVGADGATAVATNESAATDAGATGGLHCGGGHGGKGGDAGKGGDGGAAGGGNDSHDGEPGQSGIGGVGGTYHTASGPGPDTEWENGTSAAGPGVIADVGSTQGAGGEGEWRGSSGGHYGPGGGGGGGYGGGGGGAGGGFDFPGGGGGGGGSYAAGVTVLSANLPTFTPASSAEVVITFSP